MDHLFKLDLTDIKRGARISASVSKLRTKKPVKFVVRADREQITTKPLQEMMTKGKTNEQ